MTVSRLHSEIMTVNQNAGVKPISISKDDYFLVKRAVEVSKFNAGFDVAIGPLTRLWHIGFDDAKVPTRAEISAKLSKIDPAQIALNDGDHSVFLKQPGMELDLGGIGKGFIADEIKQFWLQNGVKQGIINLGGNVLLVGGGSHENQTWTVGIREPFESSDDYFGILATKETSLVTSGIYERFLRKGNKFYHHIIDPRNGYPLKTNLASATGITPKSTEAEVWSSLGFFNGPYGFQKYLSHAKSAVSFIFVTQDHQVYISKEIANNFKIVDPAYKIEALI